MIDWSMLRKAGEPARATKGYPIGRPAVPFYYGMTSTRRRLIVPAIVLGLLIVALVAWLRPRAAADAAIASLIGPWALIVSWRAALAGLVCSTALGIGTGAIAAARAARLEPVQALRGN